MLLVNGVTNAQNNRVVVVTTWHLTMPEGGSRAEFDSLSNVYQTQITNKNPNVLNSYVARHFWGKDSRQVVLISEYESIDKMLSDSDAKLIEAAFPDKEKWETFFKEYNKYWNGYHSDEIYSVISNK